VRNAGEKQKKSKQIRSWELFSLSSHAGLSNPKARQVNGPLQPVNFADARFCIAVSNLVGIE
jgi:hypothetical protein